MTEELEDLKRRLVVGHKRDGRSVYDEAAKTELVELCLQPGASISRLARECDVNANQVARWLREQGHGPRRPRPAGGDVAKSPAAFVPLPVVRSTHAGPDDGRDVGGSMTLQARLPNGVAIDLRNVDARHVGEVVKALGRLACSASTMA